MRKLFKLLSAFSIFACVLAFSLTGAKAASFDFDYRYTNESTGYKVAVADEAGIFSASEITDLVSQMAAATEYGNIVLCTVSNNRYGSTEQYGDQVCSYFSYTSTTVIIIDMDNHYLQIQSSGANEKRMTPAKASTITDNFYGYASDGDYFSFVQKSVEQILLVLEGARIAQPMKYICNALLAVALAVLFNFIGVKMTSGPAKTTDDDILSNLSAAGLDTRMLASSHLRHERIYSPQSSGGGGGHGGGGGGGGGGHSSGGGHSF